LVDENSDSIYMCGNSLGLQPKGVKKYIDQLLDKWANMYVNYIAKFVLVKSFYITYQKISDNRFITTFRGVFGHMEQPLPWAFCDEYAVDGYAKLVGAEKGEVVMMNGLSINLHLMMVRMQHVR
jgi:kynureninase